MKLKAAVAVILVLLVVAGTAFYLHNSPAEQPTNQTPKELRVFVATSLINVVENASKPFERENNCKIVFNSGSSDKLYQQIYSGSPADVYVAADFKWTKKLKEDMLLYNNEYWNFTTNKLIVILPADNPKNITTLLELTNPDTRIIVADWSVPVGSYTNKTLTKIENTWGNPGSPKYKGEEWEHFKDKIIGNIVSYEPTVQDVVGKVKLGNCDAGFAYVSDVIFQGSNLKYIKIPDEVNTKGTYGIAVINDSTQHDLASRYAKFWLSDEGQKLLKEYGFGTDIIGS